MKKKDSLVEFKDPNCLNCGYPFSGHEVFCPDCGQKNKGNKITFINFIKEVFNGFISWDAKFWTTIIPLLIKPGKVSRDYIEGKRQRYANPFRFYLTISIIFFLILGLSYNIEKFKSLDKNTTEIKETGTTLNSKETSKEAKIDKQKIESENKKDTIAKANKFSLTIAKGSLLDKFKNFENENQSLSIDEALDNLGYERNFINRLIYNRAKTINKIGESEENFIAFLKESLSYISISLFILLPIFTLFLKIFYIRKKHTYVEHLVFVFNIQTVFFLLLSSYLILLLFNVKPNIILFIVVFLVYLFLAMKKFYQQGFFKTFFKFFLINLTYLIIAILGFSLIIITSITFY